MKIQRGPVDGGIAATAPAGSRAAALPTLDLAVAGVFANAIDAASTSGGVAVTLRRKIGERWFVAAGGAMTMGPEGVASGVDVVVRSFQVRAGLGRTVGRVGVSLAPLLAIHSAISGGAGDASTAVPGAGVAIDSRWAIGDRVGLVLGGGIDLYAWRDHFMVAGAPAVVTPQTVSWVSLGLSVRLAR